MLFFSFFHLKPPPLIYQKHMRHKESPRKRSVLELVVWGRLGIGRQRGFLGTQGKKGLRGHNITRLL